jgi:hypothetical protein
MATTSNDTANDTKARILKTREELCSHLTRLGHAVASLGDNVDGVYTHLTIREERRRNGGWRSVGSGRLRVTFGVYGSLQQFPEPKVGFDYAKLAEEISAFVKDQLKRDELNKAREARYEAALTAARRLNAEPRHPSASIGVDRYNHLKLEINCNLSEEQARQLLAAASAILKAGGA